MRGAACQAQRLEHGPRFVLHAGGGASRDRDVHEQTPGGEHGRVVCSAAPGEQLMRFDRMRLGVVVATEGEIAARQRLAHVGLDGR